MSGTQDSLGLSSNRKSKNPEHYGRGRVGNTGGRCGHKQ